MSGWLAMSDRQPARPFGRSGVAACGGAIELSLIISTRNRCRRLDRCLRSVRRIESERAWELVIVDNGSTDDTGSVIRQHIATATVPTVHLREPRPGKSIALNAALAVARGEVLAFTDDDCYPAPDFVDRASLAFEDPTVGYVTGRVLLYDPTDHPTTINESIVPLLFAAHKYLAPGSVVGANMAFRRAAILGIGGFDPLFGPGTACAGAEDTEAACRASARGWTGRYCPDILVSHHHGRKAADLPRLMKSYGTGIGAYHMKLLSTGYGRRWVGRILYGICGQLIRTPMIVLWQPVGATRYARRRILRRSRDRSETGLFDETRAEAPAADHPATEISDSARGGTSREETRILLRTHLFDDFTDAFLLRLRAETGLPVSCLVDETKTPVDCRGWEKISITREICEQIGLYCPDDFGWRCGDYGLYLASRHFARTETFWLVEYDLRFCFDKVGKFFDLFTDYRDIDLIVAHLNRRFADWYWHSTMAGHGSAVFGCFFPLVRISKKALNHLLAARRTASATRHPAADNEWPNDEIFVSTVLQLDGFRCRDLNSFGQKFYTNKTLNYNVLFDGDSLDKNRPDGMIYHPVLYGEAYKAKLARVTDGGRSPLRQRLIALARQPRHWLEYILSRGGRRYGFWS